MARLFILQRCFMFLREVLVFARSVLARAFAAIDQNGDGKVTKDELDAWLKNRAAKSPDKFTYKPSQTKGALKKLDKNEDGTLSLQEWIKAPESKK